MITFWVVYCLCQRPLFSCVIYFSSVDVVHIIHLLYWVGMHLIHVFYCFVIHMSSASHFVAEGLFGYFIIDTHLSACHSPYQATAVGPPFEWRSHMVSLFQKVALPFVCIVQISPLTGFCMLPQIQSVLKWNDTDGQMVSNHIPKKFKKVI